MISTPQLLILAVFCVWSVYGQRPPPNYSLDDMPLTSFNCRDKSIGGYYADPEAECQMFHVCVKLANNDVQDFRFLCPNDTVFDQENQICANWFDIDCEANSLYYAKGFDLLRIGHGIANEDLLQKTPLVPERRLPPVNRQRDDQDIFRGSSSSDIHRGRDEEDFEHQKSKIKQKPANRKGGRRRPIATVTSAPESRFNEQEDFTTVTKNQPSSSFTPPTENVETTRHFTTAPNQQFSSPAQQPNYQQPPNRNNFQQQSPAPQRNNFQQQQSPAPQRNNFQYQSTPAPQQNFQQTSDAPKRNNFQQQQSPAPQRNNFQYQSSPAPQQNFQQTSDAPKRNNFQQQKSPAPQRNNFQYQSTPAPQQNFQQNSDAPKRNNFQQQQSSPAPQRSNFQINVPNRQQDAPLATPNRGRVTFQNDQGNSEFQRNRNQVPGDVARSQTRNLQQNQQNVAQQNVLQQQNVPQQRRNFRNKQRVQSNFASTPVPAFQESSPTADPTLLTPTYANNQFVSSTFQPQSIPTSTYAPTTYKGQYTEPSTATISPATYNAFQTRKNQQRKGGFNSTPLPNSIGNEQRTFASSPAPTFQQSISPAFSQPQQQSNFSPTTYRPRALNNVPQPFQQRRVPPPPAPRDDFINDQHPDELLKTAHSSSFRASDLNSIQKNRPPSTTVSPFGAPSSPRSFTPPRQHNKPIQPESRRINNNQFNSQPSTQQFSNQPSTQQFNRPTENVFVTQSTTPNPIGFTGTHFFNPSTPEGPSSTDKPVFNQQFTASTPSSFNQQSAFTQSTPRPFQQQNNNNQQNFNRQQFNNQQQTNNQQTFNKQAFNNQQTSSFNNNRQQSNFNQQQNFNRQPQQNFNNQQEQSQQSQQTFNKQSFNKPTSNNFFAASTSKPSQQVSQTSNTFFSSPVNQQFSGAIANSTPRSFEVKSTVYTPSSPAPFQSTKGNKPHKKASSDYDYAYYDDSPIDYDGVEPIPSEFSKTKTHKN